jgi:hypothetical protein
MEAAHAIWPTGRPRLALVPPLTEDKYVAERERLEALYDDLMRLASDLDPVRAAVVRMWAATVRGWLRFGP